MASKPDSGRGVPGAKPRPPEPEPDRLFPSGKLSGPAVFIGIDPGVNGGLAWVSVAANGKYTVKADPMPETRLGILKWFSDASGSQIPRYVVMEKVGGFISSGWGEGKKNMASAHTMFAFGKSVGWVEMALEVFGMEPKMVVPKVWQDFTGVLARQYHKVGKKVVWDEKKEAYKGRLKTKAVELFPSAKPTLKTCDALLLAWYGIMNSEAITPSCGVR